MHTDYWYVFLLFYYRRIIISVSRRILMAYVTTVSAWWLNLDLRRFGHETRYTILLNRLGRCVAVGNNHIMRRWLKKLIVINCKTTRGSRHGAPYFIIILSLCHSNNIEKNIILYIFHEYNKTIFFYIPNYIFIIN